MQSTEDILAHLGNWPQLGGQDAPEKVWNMDPDRTMSIPGNVRIDGTLTVRGQPVGPLAAQAQAAEAYSAEDVAQLLGELADLRERVTQLEAAVTEGDNGGRKRRR